MGLNKKNFGGREKISTSRLIDVVKSQKIGYIKKASAITMIMYLTTVHDTFRVRKFLAVIEQTLLQY